MHAVRQPRAGTQTGVGADHRLRPDFGAFKMGEGPDLGPLEHRAVGKHAVRPHAHPVGEHHVAGEDAADVDRHVQAALERAAHLEPRRIEQRHPGAQEPLGLAPLIEAFELGQLRLVVYAGHFRRILRFYADHRHGLAHRGSDDVGQIVFALGVGVGERLEPTGEAGSGQDHHAGVDLIDRAHLRIGILFLDDGANAPARVAHDAPVAPGIGQPRGEDRQRLAALGRFQQAGKRLRPQ